MKPVIDGNPKVSPRTDRALLKRLHEHPGGLTICRQAQSFRIVEIGRREKVGYRHVSRIIRFAFLATDIIEQIAARCQPPELGAECF